MELSLLPEKAVVSSGDSTTQVGVSLCPRIRLTLDAGIVFPARPRATCSVKPRKEGWRVGGKELRALSEYEEKTTVRQTEKVKPINSCRETKKLE